MGLDAVVHCDCFERGRLRSPPPAGCTPSVDEWGFLHCGSNNLAIQLAFDRWQFEEACEHEDGLLVHHRIGNIALVAGLRTELQRHPDRFPMLLARVVYNGVHSGDLIPAGEVSQFRPELDALALVRCEDPEMGPLMREFATQMEELVVASLTVCKPIVF